MRLSKASSITIILMAGLFYSTGIKQSNTHAQESGGLADTPWPMYQHDPQHTGRSPFLGPIHQPEHLWSVQLPETGGTSGGISIAQDGDLLISYGGFLNKFNPVNHDLLWKYPYGGFFGSVPLVGDDSNIYWGYANVFDQIGPDGKTKWQAILDDNYGFGSSPTFGMDGNLYFVHDALWSFTPLGVLRWYYPYGIVFSQASPAISPNGTIYAGGQYTPLCAYQSDGGINWCLDLFYTGTDRNPAISSDGTIYLPYTSATLLAINPDGSIKWEYKPEHAHVDNSFITDGIAIAPDGSIREFITDSLDEKQNTYLYSLDENGQHLWHVTIPTNWLTGFVPMMRYPLLTDRAGNTFFALKTRVAMALGRMAASFGSSSSRWWIRS